MVLAHAKWVDDRYFRPASLSTAIYKCAFFFTAMFHLGAFRRQSGGFVILHGLRLPLPATAAALGTVSKFLSPWNVYGTLCFYFNGGF